MTKRAVSAITLEFIDPFHARGMRRLQAFGVRFAGSRKVYRCDIWAAKDGRLLVRYNCPTESDYDEAHEICGLKASDLSQTNLDSNPMEPDDVWLPWVPQCVRDRWVLWLNSVI